MHQRLDTIKAKHDAKGFGNLINALAAQGRIRGVQIVLSDGRTLLANSAWAATDWLRDEGFYESTAHLTHPTYRVEYLP